MRSATRASPPVLPTRQPTRPSDPGFPPQSNVASILLFIFIGLVVVVTAGYSLVNRFLNSQIGFDMETRFNWGSRVDIGKFKVCHAAAFASSRFACRVLLLIPASSHPARARNASSAVLRLCTRA